MDRPINQHLKVEAKLPLDRSVSRLRTDCTETDGIDDLPKTGVQGIGGRRWSEAQLWSIRTRMVQHVAGIDPELHVLRFADSE